LLKIDSRVGPIRGGNNFREKVVWTEIGPMVWGGGVTGVEVWRVWF
jgi:hypothetical protein